MELQELAKNYLDRVNIIQLATIDGDKPWLCTVHFYVDNALNIYWVSRTDRNHSQHIAKAPQVAATAVIHENTSQEDYVISVTVTGKAQLMTDAPEKIRRAYVTKLNKQPQLLPDFRDPNNLQEFYCLQPETAVIFDTKKFPKEPRQEAKL